MFLSLFNEIFFRPLFNALVVITDFLPSNDLGLAVIILTLLVRIILFPLMHRSAETQTRMKMIEPELKKIRDNFKDKEEQARRIMELYRTHGINPFSSLLLTFLQLPVLIALYFVFRESISSNASFLYSFVSMPENIHTNFLGLIDLGGRSVALAAVAGISQFLQLKLAQLPGPAAEKKKTPGGASDFGQIFSKQMVYMMPVLIFFITLRFPAAVGLYWTTTNVFGSLHEGIIRGKARKIYEGRNGKNSGVSGSPA